MPTEARQDTKLGLETQSSVFQKGGRSPAIGAITVASLGCTLARQ